MLTLERPDILAGTPGRVISLLKDRVCVWSQGDVGHCHVLLFFQTLHLKNSLEVLVVDEADLLFSFGYEEDLKTLLRLVLAGGGM